MKSVKKLVEYAVKAYDGVVSWTHDRFESARGTNADLRKRLEIAEAERDRSNRTMQTQLDRLVERGEEVKGLQRDIKVNHENYLSLQRTSDANLERAEKAEAISESYRAAMDAMRANPNLTPWGSFVHVFARRRDPSFVLDREGAIVSLEGRSLRKRLKYDPKSLVGQEYAEMLYPNDRKEFSNAVREIADDRTRTITGFDFDVGIKNNENGFCPYRLHVTVKRSDDGSEIDSMTVVTKRVRSVGNARNFVTFPVEEILSALDDYKRRAAGNEAFAVNFRSLGRGRVQEIEGLRDIFLNGDGVPRDNVILYGIRDDGIYDSLRELGVSHQSQMGMRGVRYLPEGETSPSVALETR